MPNICHALLIGASAEKIYNAVTTTEGLSAWWTPGASAKPEPGTVARFPFGPNYDKEMKIAELKPLEKVKWHCVAGAGEWIGTTLSFEIYPGDRKSLANAHPEMQGQVEQANFDKGSLLVFRQNDWMEYTPMYAECNYTWGQFLRSLKLYCETGKGLPWPHQHRTER